MNAITMSSSFDALDSDVDSVRSFEPMPRGKQRRPEPRRKQGGNGGGFHARRAKHFTWGCGAGARLADLRAFAGALLLALVALAAPASADSFGGFDWTPIEDSGNAANPITGLGSVSKWFKMSTYETTNSQYAYFLNNSAAGKQDLFGVYNANMGTDRNGGITRTFDAGTQTWQYAVKANYGDRPVTWVNWFSAARFINWYANGADTSASTENGSYSLGGATSGPIVARNANARIYLPNANEWTKAAYYDATASSYKLYPTGSDSQPTGTVVNKTDPNTANFAQNATFGQTTEIGAYTNTKSTYGLFDMLGNVTEMSDTSNASGNWQPFGGSWVTNYAGLFQWESDHIATNAEYRTSTAANGTLGFRVAAVPEPSNVVAAAMGLGGLIALQFAKRRKLALARVAA